MQKPLSLLIFVLLLLSSITPSQTLADNNGGDIQSEYFQMHALTMADGSQLAETVINGPPEPPPGYDYEAVALPEPNLPAGLNVITNVPAFDWSFGCSATSAAMIAGYYDRTGYPNMYAGPTNDGIMPVNNSPWPDWVDSHGDTRAQCPLSATHNGLDGRATNGHVDDYWIYYGQPGPDPWVTNGWTQHTYGDCTGDYMKTNQWVNPGSGFNTDGSTTFYYYTSGVPLPDTDMEGYGIDVYDGGYGIKLFFESRGYTVNTLYNQYIYGYNGNTLGFTYAQYKAEIDAGHPVIINITGHTMVGLGYDDSSGNLMYIHDTWDYSTHTMTWGGSYGGMTHYAVTVVHLDPWGHHSVATGSWGSTGTWDAGTVPTAADDVTIKSGHTVTISGAAQCNHLNIQAGGVLEIAGGASLKVEGTLNNAGTLKQTRTVSAGGTTEFLHITNNAGTTTKAYGVDITPNTTSMGATTVEIKGNQNMGGCTDNPSDALLYRCYRITPGSSQSAAIRYWFTEDERNGQSANALKLWHYDGPPGQWSQVGSGYAYSEGTTACTTASGRACWFQAQNVSTYSPFVLGSGASAPTAITLKAISAWSSSQASALSIWLLALGLAALAGLGFARWRRRRGA